MRDGGLRKTETARLNGCLPGTIAADTTPKEENRAYSAARVKKSCSAHGKPMPSLSGEDSLMIRGSKASTAHALETNPRTKVLSLSDRLTQSLISCGLVCGIIPLSMRDGSGQLTLDSVLRPPGGKLAGKQKEGL